MSFPHEIFKAYDIRGIVDRTLTGELVEQIGRAIGTESREKGCSTVVVGWDGRLSSPGLAGALSGGLAATGCGVLEIGQVPTPVLYRAAADHGAGTGVQVTGSHNPPGYNGLKIMIDGQALSGAAIQRIKERVRERDFIAGSGERERLDYLPEYSRAVLSDIRLSRPLRIVIDCGNGVAGNTAPEIFRGLGCEVTELFCEVDGNFPNHHPDPSQAGNLQDLIAAVRQHGADIGLAFDGDGDRLGVVSSRGSIIWPDRVMVLIAEAVLADHPGAGIIFDVKCSQVLRDAILRNGGRACMWKTGHSLIKAKLRETGAVFAGEMSGHLFFNDRWRGFDDGIYAGARLCELISRQSATSDQLFAGIPDTVNTPELRLDMPEGTHHELVDTLVRNAHFPGARVSTLDGVRADYAGGFGLVRASNTTPSVIMRFEASDARRLAWIMDEFRQRILQIRPGTVLPF